jgi:chemotaxis response regulator CheB
MEKAQSESTRCRDATVPEEVRTTFHDIIAIGGSAGGIEALKKLCSALPADLPAAVFVVIHLPPTSHSVLPQLLSGAGPLPACHPGDGDPIERGTIYVAPPDMYLLMHPSRVGLRRGPHENRSRPSIELCCVRPRCHIDFGSSASC